MVGKAKIVIKTQYQRIIETVTSQATTYQINIMLHPLELQ